MRQKGLKWYSFVIVFALGFLISFPTAFGDFGGKDLTSASYILKGFVTSGGRTLTSGSYSLYGSLGQANTQPSSSSYAIVPEWPAIFSQIQYFSSPSNS